MSSGTTPSTSAIWKRIVGFVVLTCASVTSYSFTIFEYKPTPATSLKGINLGDKESDVQFRYEGFEVSKSLFASTRGHETYLTNEIQRLEVTTHYDRTVYITYVCNDNLDQQSLSNIRCGDPSEKIMKRFPTQDISILCYNNDRSDGFRFYDAIEKYNIGYFLKHNKVAAFIVAAKNYDPDGNKFILCKNKSR